MLASDASSVVSTDLATLSSAWKRVRVKKESTKSATVGRDIFKVADGRCDGRGADEERPCLTRDSRSLCLRGDRIIKAKYTSPSMKLTINLYDRGNLV